MLRKYLPLFLVALLAALLIAACEGGEGGEGEGEGIQQGEGLQEGGGVEGEGGEEGGGFQEGEGEGEDGGLYRDAPTTAFLLTHPTSAYSQGGGRYSLRDAAVT